MQTVSTACLSFFTFTEKIIPFSVIFFTICADNFYYKVCNMYYKLSNMCYKLCNKRYKVCNKKCLISK